jgi:hypothetical protein
MILERTRELVINLGNNTYESARIAAKVVLDSEQVTNELLKAHNVIDITGLADVLLTIALADEVKYWHEITTKKDSFIHLVHQDNTERETKNG